MKKLFLAAFLAFGFLSPLTLWAQKKVGTPAQNPAGRSMTSTNSQTGTNSRDRFADINIGYQQNAMNFGGVFGKNFESFGFGGYFHIQNPRERENNVQVVYKSTALGIQTRASLQTSNKLEVYAAPGFGMIQFQDIPDSTGKKSDVTSTGPSLSLGFKFPITERFKLGLDRFEAWNWFDDKAPASLHAYRLSATLLF